MIILGAVLGLVLGGLFGGFIAALLGAVVGGALGAVMERSPAARADRSRESERAPPPPAYGSPAAGASAAKIAGPTTAGAPGEVAERLARIERRLTEIEAKLGIGPIEREAPAPRAFVAEDGTMRVAHAATAPATGAVVMAPTDVGALAPREAPAPLPADEPEAGDRAAQPAPPAYESPQPLNPLWAWFTGGNAMTRIGAVVLFFGVAFLLRYFAERLTVPLEWRLAAVGIAGVALAAAGAVLARRRPAYGLSLEGAGAGIVYLTAFAAFRFYAVLPAPAAFALLVAASVAVVVFAVRADSQPLAALALAGGFLAPILISTRAGSHVLLFGYFALLNAAIFAIAWSRAWRALNVLGFVFTFALGGFWGYHAYRPEHFSTVQPFLALFFAFYVAIAALYARRAPLAMKAPVDALLVFGVPLLGFALETALVREFRYGIAVAALAIATVYALLWFALRSRAESGLALLARAFLVLALIFATVAIPYAVDPQWTSAWWAIEAAAVYWIGCRQRQRLVRAFAMLLQLGAAIMFLGGDFSPGDRLFLNAAFFGTSVIGLAGLATAWLADRHAARLQPVERQLVAFAFAWGALWWLGGGALDTHRLLSRAAQGNAMLAFVAASVALALVAWRPLGWPRLAWSGAALLPAMAIAGVEDWQAERTTLLHGGYLAWPLAWLVQGAWLRGTDADLREDGESAMRVREIAPAAHLASVLALVAWLAWEASEWVGRWTEEGTVWMACAAALPPIVFLALMVRMRDATGWPLSEHHDLYASRAGTTIAAVAAIWFVIVNFVSPGDPSPLPYVPLANPLDLTLAATLGALVAWARRFAAMPQRTLYAWLGVAIFLAINGVVIRSAHHLADVPWQASALVRSKPLQAALTLTWTFTALPLMVLATRRAIRPLWMAGAALLALVVAKLFLVDLAALSGLPRVVAFLGAGAMLLVIGYFAPLPPSAPRTPADESERPRPSA